MFNNMIEKWASKEKENGPQLYKICKNIFIIREIKIKSRMRRLLASDNNRLMLLTHYKQLENCIRYMKQLFFRNWTTSNI